MSLALYNDMKKIREQILDLLRRIESLEESRLAQSRAKRDILTMPPRPESQKAANVQK